MATLQKHGKHWTIRYFDSNKKRKRKILHGVVSKREANAHLQQFELATQKKVILRSPLFGDFVSDYLAKHELTTASKTHKRIYDIVYRCLLPRFGDIPLNAISDNDLNLYFKDRKKTVAFGTLEKELNTIKAILNDALTTEVILKNPIANYSLGKNPVSHAPPYYQKEQLELLFAHSDFSPRWQFLVNTGLRRSEALQLKKEHIEHNINSKGDSVVHVVSTENARTKSAKYRAIPLNNKAKEAIAALDEDSQWTGNMDRAYVFPQVHETSLTRSFKNHVTACQLPGSLHWLRHTYCTYHVLAGTPIRAIQMLAGHSTVAVTEKYTHVISELNQFAGNINV